jgi:hypothetical protein
MERPMGVKLIAIGATIVGLWNLFITYSAMWMGGWLSWVTLWTGAPPTDLPPNYAALGPSAFWIALLGMAAAILTLVAAGGLWAVKLWGWWLAIAGLALILLTNGFTQFRGLLTLEGTIGSLLAIAALIYLLLPHVRSAFTTSSASSTSA